jgi:predicted metal-dependent phosphoesterase TrpH
MPIVDLHIHTNFSDGKFSPTEIVGLAKKAGMQSIGITDHDSVDGLEEAVLSGNDAGLDVIPGIEFSTDLNGKEIHILGYFIDYKNPVLLDYINTMRANRWIRLESMVDKLNLLEVQIEPSEVSDIFTGDIAFGRPHLALTMVKKGIVKNYYEAFIKYIGDGKPACVIKNNPPFKEVLKLINETGGLSFLAHPGKYVNESGLSNLINEGIDGIEIIHPSHSPSLMKHYSSIASEYFLLESGGSDFHGIVQADFDNFGKFHITSKEINNMKVRLQ